MTTYTQKFCARFFVYNITAIRGLPKKNEIFSKENEISLDNILLYSLQADVIFLRGVS